MGTARVAIVGAGVAGLVAARDLAHAGLRVRVFDKGRGVGGRVSTRRREQGAFDHGAQRFGARSPALLDELHRWEQARLVERTENIGEIARLVLHASAAFSAAHLDASEASVAPMLLSSLRERPGFLSLRVRAQQAHRWRYARVHTALGSSHLFDAERGLGVAGDGLLGPRIEAAYTSGRALAAAIIERG